MKGSTALSRVFAHLSVLLGRTYEEAQQGYYKFKNSTENSLFHIVYWMGKLAIEDTNNKNAREITFSSTLRERIGHHTYGELWANKIKKIFTRAKPHRKAIAYHQC